MLYMYVIRSRLCVFCVIPRNYPRLGGPAYRQSKFSLPHSFILTCVCVCLLYLVEYVLSLALLLFSSIASLLGSRVSCLGLLLESKFLLCVS